MPNSYKTHTTDGTTTLFSFAEIDGWVSTGFIKVYLDGVLQTTGYSLVDLTTSTPKVQFTTAPAASKVLLISRETPSTVSSFQNNIVDFNNGSVLTEADLDNLAKGLLHVAQEAKDAGANSLGLAADGTWDAASRRIANVSSPIGPYDAVNKQYLDGYDLTGTAWTVPQSWTFTGNGSTTGFTWSSVGGPTPATTDAAMFIVEVGGVIQRPGASPNGDYTITTNAITFSEAPNNTVGIRVRNFGVARDIPVWGNPITFSGLVTAAEGITSPANCTFGGVDFGSLSASQVFVGEIPTNSGLSSNTVGIGKATLGTLATGSNCVAVGYSAATALISGNKNTSIGAFSSVGSTGSENTSVGYNAGYNASAANPNQSIYLGAEAKASGSVTNEIVIGYNATGDGSNTAVIGNTNTTQTKTRGNLVSTGSITSTGAMTANGNLSSTGTLSVTGAGTSSISGTLNVPAITGLTSLSATTLTGTTINGTNITATNSVTVGSATLSAPSGAAPMFAPRAWANFCSSVISTESNRTELTGTWVVESANVLVMNIANHGFAVNHVFRGILTGGYSDTLHFTVTTVVNTGQIKVTARVTDTVGNVNFPVTTPATGGNVAGIWKATIRSSGNVSSIVVMDNNLGRFAVNFTSPLPNANYSFIGTASNGNGTANTGAVANATLFEANRANGGAIEFSRKTVNCLEFWCSTGNPHSANFVVFA